MICTITLKSSSAIREPLQRESRGSQCFWREQLVATTTWSNGSVDQCLRSAWSQMLLLIMKSMARESWNGIIMFLLLLSWKPMQTPFMEKELLCKTAWDLYMEQYDRYAGHEKNRDLSKMGTGGYIQYRQKVWTHQVTAKPRFFRLPRTRFGRTITTRFSGNAEVDRKPRPNRCKQPIETFVLVQHLPYYWFKYESVTE